MPFHKGFSNLYSTDYSSRKDIVKVRSEIEKHFKTDSTENEVNDAINSIVAAANNNGEAEDAVSKDIKEQPEAGKQLTNGDKAAATEATSS